MTQKTAFVFPGQGSQSVGMLSHIAAQYPLIQQTFNEASSTLGFDLWALAQDGPLEKLNLTEYTQPAILTASVALYRLYQEVKGINPDFFAGHSLGEYSALVAANALSLADGVRLVSLRGQLMQQAVPEGVGAMAAILGLEDEAVLKICQESALEEVVAPANYNSPGQVVIGGHKTAVLRAMDKAKEYGAKRALLLPMSVPSHGSLMTPAALKLEQALNKTSFKMPEVPVIQNADVLIHSTVDEIRNGLVKQLYSPVRWVETISRLYELGVRTVLECGPGAVLSGLNKRIVAELECQSIANGEALCL